MKSKTKKTVGAVAGSAVVLGSLVLLHKSGKVEHLGTVVKQGGKVVVNKTKAAAQFSKEAAVVATDKVRSRVSKARAKRPTRVKTTGAKPPTEGVDKVIRGRR